MEDKMEDKKFKYILDCVSDSAKDLLYYDREECEEVSVKDCKNLTDEQIEEIIKVFSNAIKNFYS